ncbi:MAG: proline--tRNA ligase [Candidatus Aenigmarchaeota archaeon]|nr:proline--tRNA ligase [Candidatus Aenigmarchaeota archaeon]
MGKSDDSSTNLKGLTEKKTDNFSEWYTQLIQKAELADYSKVSGCIVFRPYSYAMWDMIRDFLDERFKKSGVENAYFPLFIPESLLMKEQEHVEGFTPEVAWVTHAGDSKLSERLAVRPTSETIMYDSYAKWVRSHNDLPLRLNQWNNVVRWEFKYPMPFLRTREFLWQEGHTVFANKEEAEKEVLEILEYYRQTYEDLLAVPMIKGKKTEKEKFAGAAYTTSVETFLPIGKAIQGATSHFLGQNFSKAFDIKFLDENGKNQYGWQNSWGFTTRSIGVMIITHSDDKGLVLPPRIAPVQVVIVPIIFEKSKKEVLEKAKEIEKSLDNFRVKTDAREEYSSGWKYNHWELKGVPIRLEIGPKDIEKNQAVLVRRDTGEKLFVKFDDLEKTIENLLEEIQKSLFEKAKKWLTESIAEPKDWNEFTKFAKEKKLILAPHCGETECEELIKFETEGIKTLCVPFDQPKIGDKCIKCGKPSQHAVYFAKSY